MADTKSPDAWMRDWQAMQQQFTSAWSQAAPQAGNGAMPLQAAFEQWSKLFGSPGGQSGTNEMLDRAMGSAKQFVDFLQGAAAQMSGAQSGAPTPWSTALGQAFGGMSAGSNPLVDALRQAGGEGSKGFEQMFKEFSAFAAPMRGELATSLSMPAFGLNRESQERKQAQARAWVEYSEQMNKYNALMLKASQRGLQIMESKLGERSEPGRELSSFRALYDLWIDAAEEGYAEVALSEEFREVYGALANAQMRVRQGVQQEVERAGEALGVPTRTELNAVHKKLVAMQRRISALEEALDGADESRSPRAEAGATSVRRASANDAPAPRRSAREAATEAAVAAVDEIKLNVGKAVKAATSAASNFAAQLAAARTPVKKTAAPAPAKSARSKPKPKPKRAAAVSRPPAKTSKRKTKGGR